MKKNLLPFLFAFALTSAFIQQAFAQATLLSDFRFNSNLTDELGNGTAAPFGVPTSSYSNIATDAQYNWVSDTIASNSNSDGGLHVLIPDTLLTENNFTIAFEVSLSNTSGYRKLIDFKNRGEDEGAYVNDQLRIYASGGYGDSTLLPNTFYNIVFHRFGSNDSAALYLFINDTLSLQSSGTDPNFYYVPVLMPDGNRQFGMFYDDSTTTSEYSDSGSVRRIRVWNGIATPQDINTSTNITALPSAEFSMYPNPASDVLMIRLNNSGTDNKVLIRDITGAEVLNATSDNTIISMDVSSLSPGLYFVQLGSSNRKFQKL